MRLTYVLILEPYDMKVIVVHWVAVENASLERQQVGD